MLPNEASQWLAVTIIVRASVSMNAFDPCYFESSQKRKRRLRIRVVTYAFPILRLRAGFHYLAILA
jgi:hypothetical protein